MKDNNIKNVKYWIESNEDFADRKLALSLFDMFGFNENIALFCFRAYSNIDETLKMFSENVHCKIIKDVTRNDCFCIFIPEIKTNLELLDLITNNDVQTEWTYIPFVIELESLLYNRAYLKNNGIINYKFSVFESYFNADFEMYFQFDLTNIGLDKIERNLKKWENTFNNLRFKRKEL